VLRPAFGELGVDAASAQRISVRLRIVSTVTLDQTGFARGRPGHPRSGGMASTNGKSCVMSCRLALVSTAVSGIPRASVRM
jgi:hypothetical protein